MAQVVARQHLFIGAWLDDGINIRIPGRVEEDRVVGEDYLILRQEGAVWEWLSHCSWLQPGECGGEVCTARDRD